MSATNVDPDEGRDPDQVIIQAYKERFGDTPNMMAVPFDSWQDAIQLLETALDTDEGYELDTEFWELLGVDPPPPDVPI
jgi:hypothetical protein